MKRKANTCSPKEGLFSKVYASERGDFFVRGKKEEVMVRPAEAEEEEEMEVLVDEENANSFSDDEPTPFVGKESMPDQYWGEYLKQVEESQGFDVERFPGGNHDGLLSPINLDVSTLYRKATEFVIKRYNMRNKGGPIKVIELTKCVTRVTSWSPLYLTFEGYDVADKKVKTYQSLVMLVPELKEHFVLRMLRVKPPQDAPREKKHPLDACCGACYDRENDVHYDRNNLHDMDAYPGMYTLEDLETYYEQIAESEGFDIDPFPGMNFCPFTAPMQRPWRKEFAASVEKDTELIIDFFSKNNGAQLHGLIVIKVNYLNSYCCPHSYITFEAKDGADGEVQTYQARILTIPRREKVEEVRLKPQKN